MVHESTIICIDNSEYMRNGDFTPTRLQAEQDAANLILQCKLRSNPENGVGLISMAEKVDVMSTLTQDSNKLFMKLHQVQERLIIQKLHDTFNLVRGPVTGRRPRNRQEIKGYCKFNTSIRVAHLALKHRQNRNHKPRIVLFIGSPMENEEAEELVKLGKKLKKEKVNVDVICFGEAEDNSEKMTSFVEALNGKDGTGSHLVTVPAGTVLTEALLSSAICRGEDGSAAPVAVPGAGMDALGFDPNEDPELAMALRVSLEDQRQRQEREARQAAEESAAESGGVDGSGHPGVTEQPAGVGASDQINLDAMTEDEQLALALRMSLQPQEQGAAMEVDEPTMDSTSSGSNSNKEAIETAKETEDDNLGQLMSDPAALQELISGLPGVEPNSELIQQITAEAAKNEEDKKLEKMDRKKDGDGSGASGSPK